MLGRHVAVAEDGSIYLLDRATVTLKRFDPCTCRFVDVPCFSRVRGGGARELRHPGGVRPWQHVLDALAGYLLLAERLAANPASFATAWNFGPEEEHGWTAARIAAVAVERFGGGSWQPAAAELAVEVPTLLLSSEQARRWLGWRTRLATEQAVEWAIDGYRALLRERDTEWLIRQIRAYAGLDRVPKAPEPAASLRPERRHAYA